MNPSITAVVMCYNEERFVYQCLSQLIPLVDQVIIWDGDFWIGSVDPGKTDVLTQASSDRTRELIEKAVKDKHKFPWTAPIPEFAYFDGMPKMSEAAARNITLQMDALRLWIRDYPDVSDFFVRNYLWFWNPFYYVITKHQRLFKLWPGREFYGANEITGNKNQLNIPHESMDGGLDVGLFNHYGYIDPDTVREKMKWYDHGHWRGCGTWWYENVYLGFDGTLQGARDLVGKNYGTLHPWGKVHPGFAADEFTPIYEPCPEHPRAMRQYFDQRGFDCSHIRFMD
jgi:hypothetical protein